MTKAELKETHPELFASIEAEARSGLVDQSALATAEEQVTQLKNDNRDLIMANSSMSATLAKSIFDASFEGSTLPKALKPKIQKLLDHKDFVAENGVLDAEAYKKSVDGEIAEWAAAGNYSTSEKIILGLSTENNAEETGLGSGEDKDDDAIAAHMLKYLK